MTARILTVAVLAGLLGCTKPSSYDPSVCQRQASVQSGAAEEAKGLTVVTLNMWTIPFVSWDIGARTAALAERLRADSAIDVVALQEMWDDDARTGLITSLRDRFPHAADFHSDHGGSGLVTLSSVPFDGDAKFLPFEDRGKWWKPWTGETQGGKGVGLVRLRASPEPLWLANLHLHACYADTKEECDRGDEYAEIRQRQLEQARSWIEATVGDDAVLVAGDFNFTRRSGHYAWLQNGANDGRGWLRLREDAEPARRIDMLWLRPGTPRRWQPGPTRVDLIEPVSLDDGGQTALSDHCAIRGTLVGTSET